MSKQNLEGGTMLDVFMRSIRLKSRTFTMAGALTLNAKDPPLQFLDPGGAARTLTLPAEADSDGLCFFIMNTADAAEVLTVQDDTPATVVTPTQNEAAIVFCDGTTWRGFVALEA